MLNKKTSLYYTALVIIVSVFIVYAAVHGWSEPSATPPQNNTSAPLNVGPSAQTKSGSLILNTDGNTIGLDIFKGNLIVDSGGIGIGTTQPSSGQQPLKLDVEGAIGAKYYCDENGNNCVSPSVIVGGVKEYNQTAMKFTGGFGGDAMCNMNWPGTHVANETEINACGAAGVCGSTYFWVAGFSDSCNNWTYDNASGISQYYGAVKAPSSALATHIDCRNTYYVLCVK